MYLSKDQYREGCNWKIKFDFIEDLLFMLHNRVPAIYMEFATVIQNMEEKRSNLRQGD